MSSEINNLGQLLQALEPYPDSALVFQAGQQQIAPDYHVTEIKHAQINSVDCGRGSETWNELLIQLLDGQQESSEPHMKVGKFINIVRQATRHLPSIEDENLYFEFSSGNSVLQKLSVASIAHHQTVGQDRSVCFVQLAGITAQCKPAMRALASAQDTPACGCYSSVKPCC